MKKNILTIVLTLCLLLSPALAVFADTSGGTGGTTPGAAPWDSIQGSLGEFGTSSGYTTDASAEPSTPAEIAGKIIGAALGLLGIIAVILIVVAGYIWMTAGGNSEKVEKAKKLLANAIIGLVIILMAYSISYFVLQKISEAAK